MIALVTGGTGFIGSQVVRALLAVTLAGVAFASFLGELQRRQWRFLAHAGLVVMLVVAVWTYWPRD